MAGVRTLMAGNLYDQAILEADRNPGTLADDAQTLKFLARTAQAANRADAAQRYARRLLRMVMLERLCDALAREGLALAAEPEAALPGIDAGRSGWQRMHMRLAGNDARGPAASFDEEAYLLGFNIFLAAANLAYAYRVAESTVAQVPQSVRPNGASVSPRWPNGAAGVPDLHAAIAENENVIAVMQFTRSAWRGVLTCDA